MFGDSLDREEPVLFLGDFREMMISGEWVERIRNQLAGIGANEFTISGKI